MMLAATDLSLPTDGMELLRHTWWHSQRNAGGWFDVVYPAFNIVEAICWFAVAVYVWRRARRHAGRRLEFLYAALWLAFGLTDLREAWAQQTWLILLKGCLLGVLLVLRRIVLRRYPNRRSV